MAELTIAQLTELLAANVDNADLLPIWDDNAAETKKITISNFRTAVGVTNWAESFSSATQATSRWIPNNAAANVNAAIVPKGTGAITAAIPDGTIVGGNARGAYAVDLQTDRNAATQVASGGYSVIVGGRRNTVTGEHGFIGAGWANSTTGNRGVIAGGESNSAATAVYQVIVGGASNSINGNGSYGFIGGGGSNSVTQTYATVGGGQSNTASGSHSVVGGGQSNTASGNQSAVFSGNTNNCSGGGQSVICGGLTNSVAGQQSAICGGRNNSIGGGGDKFAFIGAGYLNSTASGNKTAIVGGQENTATADYSVVVGGQSNASSGSRSFIGCGERNTASGSFSSVVGGFYATANLYGQQAYAAGRFSANGDAQAHELVWRRAITGTATTELFLDGASIAAILPATNAVWHGIIDISSICTVQGVGTTVVGDVAATSYKVTIKRIGTNTSLVGSVQEIGTLNADVSMAAVAFLIGANDTNESLQIAFTPPPTAGADTVIRVVATFRGTQIQY